MRPNFYLSGIEDEFVRENFRLLDDYLRDVDFLAGEFRHIEIVLESAVTNFKFAHNLGFVPRDIILTFVTDGATVTWDYDSFDRENIQLDTSAACTIRFFVGRYEKERGSV